MSMPEEFLHYVWQFKQFDVKQLKTVDGLALQILQSGMFNRNAGPDFTNAKIILDNTTWAGQVEIHLKSSDWNLHQHQNDAAYNNVILHVVWEHDKEVFTLEGQQLPTLVLADIAHRDLFDNYENLINNLNYFPCQQQIGQLDSFVIDTFISRVLVERFEHKSAEIFELLETLNGHWDETFYRFIARNFGFKTNALPMQMLASSLSQNLFAKHKDNSLQIAALLFGQAGFLSGDFDEEYPNSLQTEYHYLSKKYQLKPLDVSLWKFLRMRPQNFPTRRLAQFAALISKSSFLFSKILATDKIAELRSLFTDLPVNPYWENHYHFNGAGERTSTALGKSSVDNLLINTVSSFLFAYAKQTGQEEFQDRAFELLDSIPFEKNAIINQYVAAGVKVKSAYQSQAILELRKQYCDVKRCLQCGIGIKILSS